MPGNFPLDFLDQSYKHQASTPLPLKMCLALRRGSIKVSSRAPHGGRYVFQLEGRLVLAGLGLLGLKT